MKAVASERYGTPDLLELKEIDRPVPLDNEIHHGIHGMWQNTSKGYKCAAGSCMLS